jgi:hypothetical protein
LLAYLDGGFGIGCGLLILVGLLDATMNRAEAAPAAPAAPNPRPPRPPKPPPALPL